MQFKKWILLLSTTSVFADVDIRSMEKNQAELVDQNARLLEAEKQMTDINTSPEKKLEYLKQLYKGLSDRDEFEKANKLKGKEKTEALEKLYRRKQIENTNLRKKQDDLRLNPPTNAPDELEINNAQYAEEEARLRRNASQEVDGQPYKDSFPRLRKDTEEKEVSSYDIQKSMLDKRRRPRDESGPATSSSDLQTQGRAAQTQK